MFGRFTVYILSRVPREMSLHRDYAGHASPLARTSRRKRKCLLRHVSNSALGLCRIVRSRCLTQSIAKSSSKESAPKPENRADRAGKPTLARPRSRVGLASNRGASSHEVPHPERRRRISRLLFERAPHPELFSLILEAQRRNLQTFFERAPHPERSEGPPDSLRGPPSSWAVLPHPERSEGPQTFFERALILSAAKDLRALRGLSARGPSAALSG